MLWGKLGLQPTSGQTGPDLGSSFGVRFTKITEPSEATRVANCPFGETLKAAPFELCEGKTGSVTALTTLLLCSPWEK